MNSPVSWVLLGVAFAATGVAIWAGDNFALAVPSAAVAVVAVGLLFADLWSQSPGADETSRREPTAEPSTIVTAFRSGSLGREEVVSWLDRLERAGPNPGLPLRRTEEFRAFARMPTSDFRRYVRHRLDELEART